MKMEQHDNDEMIQEIQTALSELGLKEDEINSVLTELDITPINLKTDK